MRHSLFRLTAAIWAILGSAVAARALILSDGPRPTGLCDVTIRVNGRDQVHRIGSYHGSLDQVDSVLRPAGREGWEPVLEELDLAARLLGVDPSETTLGAFARVRVYRREGAWRVLALAGSQGSVRFWRFETPTGPGPVDRDLETIPIPPHASPVFNSRSGDLRFSSWRLPDPSGFATWARSQGFTVRSVRNGEDAFPLVLEKGPRRSLVFLGPRGPGQDAALQFLEYGRRVP